MAVGRVDGQKIWGGSGRGGGRQEPLLSDREILESEAAVLPRGSAKPSVERKQEPFREAAD